MHVTSVERVREPSWVGTVWGEARGSFLLRQAGSGERGVGGIAKPLSCVFIGGPSLPTPPQIPS